MGFASLNSSSRRLTFPSAAARERGCSTGRESEGVRTDACEVWYSPSVEVTRRGSNMRCVRKRSSVPPSTDDE